MLTQAQLEERLQGKKVLGVEFHQDTIQIKFGDGEYLYVTAPQADVRLISAKQTLFFGNWGGGNEESNS